MIEPSQHPKLSAQEKRVLERRMRGLTLKEIASEMGISINTAKDYLKRIFRKTGARSSIQAICVRVVHIFDMEDSPEIVIPIVHVTKPRRKAA